MLPKVSLLQIIQLSRGKVLPEGKTFDINLCRCQHLVTVLLKVKRLSERSLNTKCGSNFGSRGYGGGPHGPRGSSAPGGSSGLLVGLVGHDDVLNLHSLLFHIWPRSLVGILSEVESECFPGATITLVVVLRDGDGTHEENSVDRQPQNFPQIMIIKHKHKYKHKSK